MGMASNHVRPIANFDLIVLVRNVAHLERTCYQEQFRVVQKVDAVSHRIRLIIIQWIALSTFLQLGLEKKLLTSLISIKIKSSLYVKQFRAILKFWPEIASYTHCITL